MRVSLVLCSWGRLFQLLDAINGDASLFMRSDEIERAWAILDPFIQASESPSASAPTEYDPGSEGPSEADAFLAADGRSWLSLRGPHN